LSNNTVVTAMCSYNVFFKYKIQLECISNTKYNVTVVFEVMF